MRKRRGSYLPPALINALEWTLQEYPNKADDLYDFDRYIEERCHSFSAVIDTSEPSSMASSVEERILEEKDRNVRRQWIVRFLSKVDVALSALDKRELKFVRCYYWEHLSMEHVAREFDRDLRTVYRIRNRILFKLVPLIMSDFVYPYQTKMSID